MPRKASNASNTEEGPPRRSTRIASQPKTEEMAKQPAPKPRTTKKRSVVEAGAQGDKDPAASKRVKGDSDVAEDTGTGENAGGVAAGESEGSGMDEDDVPALAPIDIGDSLPSLVLKNEKDEDLEISQIATEKGVVMFLVPKADTPGCTTQACGFRDSFPDFTQYGYTVYGLSADSPKAQSNWQVKKELPYPLISDPKRILITALGAAEGGRTKRSHFVFEKGGKLVDKKIPVTPAESPTLALEFVKGTTVTTATES